MKKFLILWITYFISATLFAEEINLEQARLLALANSRSLAKYNLSIKSSTLDEKSQLFTMLPTVSAEYSASMNYLNRNWGFENPLDTFITGANFSVSQMIFNGGKSFVQRSISSISTESVRKEALAEFFNVLDAVDNAYYAALEKYDQTENIELMEAFLKTQTERTWEKTLHRKYSSPN